MNYLTAITTDEASRRYLADKVKWLLDLMDKEHQHATTHAQRNHYQAVIRIELQIMLDELQHGYNTDQGIFGVPLNGNDNHAGDSSQDDSPTDFKY